MLQLGATITYLKTRVHFFRIRFHVTSIPEDISNQAAMIDLSVSKKKLCSLHHAALHQSSYIIINIVKYLFVVQNKTNGL